MLKPIIVRICRINDRARIPKYATLRAAGMDLHASITEEIILFPGDRELVSTGLAIEIPEGFEGQIRPRSGLALHHGVTVLNTPGTIDADYRGELKIIIANFGKNAFQINHNDRIAQLVIAPVTHVLFEVVANRDDLSKTDRGDGGCGSTGY
jgi:dUTP pyrophosphatase